MSERSERTAWQGALGSRPSRTGPAGAVDRADGPGAPGAARPAPGDSVPGGTGGVRPAPGDSGTGGARPAPGNAVPAEAGTAAANTGAPGAPGADLRLGPRTLRPGELAVMAIVNRTPDSFFDRGATFTQDAALRAVERAVGEGADLIDIGGVKAGPGKAVDATEEIRRTVSTISAVRAEFPDVVISIDTWRAEVAREAVPAGADLINDTWSGADPELAAVAAATGAALVCSHAGGLAPRTGPHRAAFTDVVADVVGTVTRLAERAVLLGVRRDGVLIDPAHDFGKNTRHSLEVTRRLSELVDTGWPVLVALSNKDFVGETLDLPVSERLEGTLAATAVAAWLGARVFRAHQVRQTRRVLDMTAAILGYRQPAVSRRGLA